jgi:hypothetical protein
MSREEFRNRYFDAYKDPAYRAEWKAIERIEAIAWDGYSKNRKSPFNHRAGEGYADPDYELSDEWRDARKAIEAADQRRRDPASRSRVLVVSGADRNDGSCPGEMSKTFRLSRLVIETLQQLRFETDDLDLSLMTSEPGRVASTRARAACRRRCALSLAAQLLSEPRGRSDQRLDERDLRTLGRCPRHRHRHAGLLVPGAECA